MLRDISDEDLLRRWAEQNCTDEGSCAEQDALADEIERRRAGYMMKHKPVEKSE